MTDDLVTAPGPLDAGIDPSSVPRPRSPYLALAVVCFALIIVVLDNSVLNIAIPALSRDLDASTSDLQWIIDSYTLVYACVMLTAGALGDRFGRRRSLIWGVSAFGLTSALASMATSSTMLIIARGLMGVSAAFMTPASLSIVINLFHDPRERARAIGVWAAAASVGAAAGPVIGGVLLEHFWWGSVFLVNVPVAIGTALVLPVLVPETKDPNPSGTDPIGVITSIIALSAILGATIAGPDHGWTSAPILGGFALGIAALVVFIWWENRCDDPMLDLGFFRIRSFTASTVSISMMVIAWSGSAFMFVQLLQSVLGFSSLEAGLRLAPFAVVGGICGLLSTRVSAVFGRRRVIVTGLLVQAIGAALFLTYDPSQGVAVAMTHYMVFTVGQSFVFAPCVGFAMDAVPREKSGVASGANNTVRQLSLAIGVAVSGSVLSTVYRSNLADRTDGLGIGAAALDDAERSIAAAVRTAQELDGDAGVALLSTARDAFVPAVHASMLLAALICAAGALISLVFLPRD